MHWKKISLLVGILLFFSAGAVHPITCEECKEVERNISSTEQEIKKQDTEAERALEKKDLPKATQAQKQISELTKKLTELRGQTGKCKDACKPDVVKKTECRNILTEIAALEADAAASEATEKIDEKYKSLANCHRELQELSTKR